jgi:hypothetical protein
MNKGRLMKRITSVSDKLTSRINDFTDKLSIVHLQPFDHKAKAGIIDYMYNHNITLQQMAKLTHLSEKEVLELLGFDGDE